MRRPGRFGDRHYRPLRLEGSCRSGDLPDDTERQLQQGSQVTGTIVGGSGKLAGISGDLSFNWSSVITQTDAEGIVNVTGQTRNLGGSYRIP